ncbi:MAG: adenine phosphoribosyltransferase [Verrucomicrobiales bacterium]|nr:adenine phosphoribosyltransferase [Verrucomicrobiales bacterium]
MVEVLDRCGHSVERSDVNQERIDRLNAAIRDVNDFPKPGIVFKDITPVLGDGALFRETIDGFIDMIGDEKPTKIIGIDARGFIFGAALADRIGAGFVPVRKKGKLPWETNGRSYSLEYGEAHVEIHKDAVKPGEKVVLLDDLLATGGTAGAALKLVQELGAEVLCVLFLIELTFLEGRKNIDSGVRCEALLTY